jgi:superfamily II DNA or RNA helicase
MSGVIREEDVTPREVLRSSDGEIEMICEVAEGAWDHPFETTTTLRLNDQGELTVLGQCRCRDAPFCRHTAAVLQFACVPENQQALEWFAAAGEDRPEGSTEVVSREPMAMLRLELVQVDGGPPVGVAVPLMRYPECEEAVSLLHRRKTHTWTDAAGAERTLERNALVERLKLADLMELGLLPFSNAFPDLAHAAPAAVLSVPEAEQVLFWSQFLTDELPGLRGQGWEIDVAKDFGFETIEAPVSMWSASLDGGSSGQDFELDLNIVHDGKRVPLIPVLVEAVRQGLSAEGLNEHGTPNVLLAVGEGNGPVVSIPAGPLRALLRFLGELLDTKSIRRPAPVRLPMNALRAAQLEDALEGLPLRYPDSLADLRQRLRDFETLRPVPSPAGLKATLREYQAHGLAWLQFLREFQLHGVLADDMGLGKTLQTLAHLLAEHEAGRADRPSLIVAPTSVLRNWAREAARFTPALSVRLLHGPNRQSEFARIPGSDLVITSYPLLTRDIEVLSEQDWHLLILDEAQNIKNPRSLAAKAACSLRARHRLCLTGTPVENHLGELWSLFHFLMPGYLGTQEHFRRAFRHPIEKDGDTERQTLLAQRLHPVLLRRTKDTVARDLPPKTELLHDIELTEAQLKLYETIRAAMDRRVRDAIADQGLDRSRILVLDALLKLRQVCCHPALLKQASAQDAAPSAKTRFLLENLLPELLSEGRRILLFSQFTEMLAILEKELRRRRIRFVKLTGETRDRDRPIRDFQAGRVPLFLISLKAGGAGLNLTAADTVIHYDPWWNPATEAQASDRAHRIGQTKPVFIHKLICEESIEERILNLQRTKAALVEGLLTGRPEKLELTKADIESLLAPI